MFKNAENPSLSLSLSQVLSRILSPRQDPEIVLATLTPNNYYLSSDSNPITFANPDRLSADIGLFCTRSRSISAITFGSGLSERRAQALPSGNSSIGLPPDRSLNRAARRFGPPFGEKSMTASN